MSLQKIILFAMLFFSIVLSTSLVQASLAANTSEIALSGTEGASVSGSFVLNNPDASNNITNISCSVSGSISSWISFSSCPSVLEKNKSTTITFNAAVPESTSQGNYTGTINVGGLINYALPSTAVQIPLRVEAGKHQEFSVVWSDSPEDFYQGETQEISFNITNTGNVLMAFSYNITSNHDITPDSGLASYGNFSLGILESKKVDYNITTSSSTNIGPYTLNVETKGTNESTTVQSIEKEFNIYYPYCDKRESGYISIYDILNEGELKDEDFKPLDSFEAEVEVENSGNERRYAIIEAVLVYGDSEVKNIDVKEKLRLSDDSKEEIALPIEIPADAKEGYYYLYIKAYDDDNEANCQQRIIRISVVKEDYEVVPFDVGLDKTKAGCGEEFSIKGKVVNIGSQTEDKVMIEYIGLNKTETKVFSSLDEGEKSPVFTFTETVPENLEEKVYDLTLRVYYDYDDTNTEYDSMDEYSEYSITVEGNCYKEIQEFSFKPQLTGYVSQGTDAKITLENTGNVNTTYKISASASWASIDSVNPNEVTINAGESSVVSIKLTPNKDASIGTHFLDVTVAYGSKTDSLKIPLNIEEQPEEQAPTKWYQAIEVKVRQEWVWIAIDIVLGLIVIGFVIYFIVRPMGSMKGFLRKIANPQIPQNKSSY